MTEELTFVVTVREQLGRLSGRESSFTCAPFLRAMTRKPSCLISCIHNGPEGGSEALVGRHGGMKPVGRTRI
jgi:hypothetical protein